MTTQKQAIVWACLATLGVCCQLAPADEQVDQILRDWANRQKMVERVHYRAEGHELQTAADLSSNPLLLQSGMEVPPEGHKSERWIELSIDFKNGRLRKGDRRDLFAFQAGFLPYVRIAMYDGKEFQLYRPRKENQAAGRTVSDFSIELFEKDERRSQFALDRADFALLLSHGIVNIPAAGVRLGNLVVPPAHYDFAYHGQASLNGREQTVLRSPVHRRTFHEVWVDVPRQSAVTRWSMYSDDKEICRVEVEHHQTNDQWMAKSFQVATFGPNETLLRQESLDVMETDFNPDFKDSLFHVEASPEMVVRDAQEEQVYVTPKPGQPQKTRAEAYEETQGQPRYRYWFSAIIIATGVGLGIYLWKGRS